MIDPRHVGKAKKSDEQKGAEAEVESFRKDFGPFVVAAETTRMAMPFTDATEPDNPIISANDSFLSLTPLTDEVIGCGACALRQTLTGSVALSRAKWTRRGQALLFLTQINAKFCGWDLPNQLVERVFNAVIQHLNLKKRKLSCLELAFA